MPALPKELPSPITSPETGELLSRGVRPFTVAYIGHSVTVVLPGHYPASEADGVLVGDDMAAADAALRELKERIDGVPSDRQSSLSPCWTGIPN